MSWYQEADKSKDLNYAPPTVARQKLDAGGNYVGTSDPALAAAGTTKTLGNSIID